MNKFQGYCLILAFFTGMTLLVTCKAGQEQIQVVEKAPVETQPVIEKEITSTIHTSGVLQSSAATKLSFKIGGIVEKIHVRESEQVKKGQVLAELKMAEINAQYEHAKTAHAKAMRDYERAKVLFDGSAASLQQKQDAESGLQMAVSNMAIADFNTRFARITAPENGKILKQLVEENEMVEAGFPALVFGSTDKSWIVKAYLTDRDIIRVHYGDSARVHFDAWPGSTFKAIISEISEAAEANTGLFKVELMLISKPARFISGLVAKIDIDSITRQRFLHIPINALVEASGNSGFVFTISDSNPVAVKLPVKILSIGESEIAISGALNKGDLVITAGAPYLNNGDKVLVSGSKTTKEEDGE